MVVFLPVQAMQEKWIWSLDWEDLLEEEMATHSSILASEVPWQKSLAGFSPWGPRALGTTEHKHEWAFSLLFWLVLEGPEEVRVPGPFCIVPGGKRKTRVKVMCHLDNIDSFVTVFSLWTYDCLHVTDFEAWQTWMVNILRCMYVFCGQVYNLL